MWGFLIGLYVAVIIYPFIEEWQQQRANKVDTGLSVRAATQDCGYRRRQAALAPPALAGIDRPWTARKSRTHQRAS
jgi:hypothetical protein